VAYYFDSSALVKRYVAESGSDWVSQICNSHPASQLYTVRITGAEIVAAIFTRTRTQSIDVSDAQTAVRQFKVDFSQYYQIMEVADGVVKLAMTLAERYPLRGYDSVQLAAAILLQEIRLGTGFSPLTFVSADKRLNKVALAESLLVENPNEYE
jgi:uncharacterized protein